ncbi:30S ribosomal protein S17 [Pneumocystis carinii B80]|uniref:Small ribosomal subunit protein uS17c n=1 Tax=Pneumocystis carinii (strain B80) TaxID=1408658 RepID=A0A0W4ZH94_PNEC8|nr:30S ribosomal protein S17 [Pneumocystis carinii B80]KTW27725.1 30S ribosomal protein S17 [Pneumocystis carinii B80]
MRQNFKGIVVSSGLMNKTVKVKVIRKVLHPKVHKLITLHKNYLVHDEGSVCKNGDLVRIEACRPLSARKRFAVAEILQKAKISQDTIDQANHLTPSK